MNYDALIKDACKRLISNSPEYIEKPLYIYEKKNTVSSLEELEMLFNENETPSIKKFIGIQKDYSILNDYETMKNYIHFHYGVDLSAEDFKNYIRGKNKRQKKRYRVDKKLMTMLRIGNTLAKENINTRVVFGTLTLNDKVLATKENTYIRKIHAYLKKHYLMVVLNKDYGKKTEREHYHFIGITREPITKLDKKSNTGRSLYVLNKQDYTLGFEPVLEIVNIEEKKQVRNYLLKLNNHTTKDSTKNTRFRVLYNPMFKCFFKEQKT